MPPELVPLGAGQDPRGGKGGGGGGGGGGSAPHYYVDLLILLTENPVGGLLRVFSDGKLVWTGRADSGSASIKGSEANGLWTRLTFYDGGKDQLPEPAYEAAVGSGNAPAYRGRSTAFVEGLDCGQGGQVPNLTFEVAQTVTATPSASTTQTFPVWNPAESYEHGGGTLIFGDVYYHYLYWSYAGAFYGTQLYFRTERATSTLAPVLTLSGDETLSGNQYFYSTEVKGAVSSGGNPKVLLRTGNGFNALQNGVHVYYAIDLVLNTRKALFRFSSGNGDGNDIVLTNAWVAYDHVSDKYVVFSYDPTAGMNQRRVQGTIAPGDGSRGLIDGIRTEVMPNWCGAVAFYNYVMYVLHDDGSDSYVRRYDDDGVFISQTEALPKRIDINYARIKANAQGVYVWYPTNTTEDVWKLVDGLTGGNTWQTLMYRTGITGRALSTTYQTHDFYATDTYITYPEVTGGADTGHTVRTVLYDTKSPTTRPVGEVVSELCLRAGLTADQIDVTGLSSITRQVKGMKLTQVGTTRSALETLAAAYFFDSVLADKLYFRPRGRAAVGSVPYADLGAGVDSSEEVSFAIKRLNDLELPPQTSVTFLDVDADYLSNTQYSGSDSPTSNNLNQVQLPLVLSASEGKMVADATQAALSSALLTASVNVPRSYTRYEPGDTVNVFDESGRSYPMRIGKISAEGPTISWELSLEDASAYTQAGVTTASPGQVTGVDPVTNTLLLVLDAPMMRDSDNDFGVYILASGYGGSWPGCSIYESRDDTEYTYQNTIATEATLGVATSALPAWTGPAVFDEVNSLSVSMYSGTLSSTTRDELLANRNLNVAIVGSEVIQFRTATLVTAGQYTLTGLLRGRRGTEGLTASHVAGEPFALYTLAGTTRDSLQNSDMGQVIYYKAATSGQTLGNATRVSGRPYGRALKCYSPTNARVNRTTTDHVVTWTRRSRFSTTFTGPAGISIPMRELAERYDIEFYTSNWTTLLRTVTDLSSPTYTYTNAMQVADTGGAVTTLWLKIYQTNELVGRGDELKVSI